MSQSSRTGRRTQSLPVELGFARFARDRRLWLALAIWLASLAGALWTAPFEAQGLTWLAFTTVGAVLVWLRPSHPVGWLLLIDGLLWIGGTASARVAAYPGSVSRENAAAAASFDLAGWIVALGLVPIALLLVPTGRFEGRSARLTGWSLIGGGTVLAVTSLVTPGPLPSSPEIVNPFGINGLPEWVGIVGGVAEAVFFMGILGVLVWLIVLYARSSGVTRQQLRWLAFAAGLMIIGFGVGTALTALDIPGAPWFNTLPMLAVPPAMAVAVFRYRLWDLDLVIRGTIAYGIVTMVVAVIYISLLAGFGALVGGGTANTWLAVLATAIAATLFQPLREAATSAAARIVTMGKRDSAPKVMIRTLGGFRLERAGEPVALSEWRSRKARQLLKMLVCRRGRPLHREQAIEALWPDAEDADLANRLAVAVSTLRGVLDPHKTYPPDYYVRGTGETLQLDLDNVTIDVEDFLQLVDSALDDPRRIDDAEELYRGDFLEEDLYEDWALPLREEARAAYLTVLHRRAAIAESDPTLGIEPWMRILEIDPWDESAHRGIIDSLATAGRHGEARRAQRRYEARMREIGVEPTPL